MKAKVTIFKMKVKAASNILSVNDIASWVKLDYGAPSPYDISMLSNNDEMKDISFSEIRIIYLSVN